MATPSRSPFRLDDRASGVLLHPSSLPGPHGSGDLGPEARRFVDFLAAAGQGWWQMLPVSPPGHGGSPYSSRSAFAGSALLISLELLATKGLLRQADLRPVAGLRPERVCHAGVARYRMDRLARAYRCFVAEGGLLDPQFCRFCRRQAAWLEDDSLFAALRQREQGRSWIDWEPGLRRRHRRSLDRAQLELSEEIQFEKFLQFSFACQWNGLRDYAQSRGVGLMGDLPLYLAHDSHDVWAHPELFLLDRRGRPKLLSGAPPDPCRKDGQLWGHPLYDWPRHQEEGFAWWVARLRSLFTCFDAVRLDHFLGFARCWAVPAAARTARHGRWLDVPGEKLFARLRQRLGRLQMLAEDLGYGTPRARALQSRYELPGMRILHMAFAEGGRHHEPHRYPRQAVVYTGTHDHNTTVGWYGDLDPGTRQRVRRYLGTDGHQIHWDLIRLALQSVADLAIIPAQDLLGAGPKERMNVPGTPRGNWSWRLQTGRLNEKVAARLLELTRTYERTSAGANGISSR